MAFLRVARRGKHLRYDTIRYDRRD